MYNMDQPLTVQQQLALAIHIASTEHLKQFDMGGKPYIIHPLHIMNQMLFDTQLATIAVLHDVVEDSDVTIVELCNYGFSTRVLEALTLLTHKEGDSYLDVYIAGICTNYDAIRVKRKDIEHNSCVTRLKGLREKDFERSKKYLTAFKILGDAKAKAKEDHFIRYGFGD